MGSSTKRQQTMAKLSRERALKEKRVRKQEKKDERKLAAAESAVAAETPQELGEPGEGSTGEQA